MKGGSKIFQCNYETFHTLCIDASNQMLLWPKKRQVPPTSEPPLPEELFLKTSTSEAKSEHDGLTWRLLDVMERSLFEAAEDASWSLQCLAHWLTLCISVLWTKEVYKLAPKCRVDLNSCVSCSLANCNGRKSYQVLGWAVQNTTAAGRLSHGKKIDELPTLQCVTIDLWIHVSKKPSPVLLGIRKSVNKKVGREVGGQQRP